jgi:dihydroxy-acid dehydratase
LRGRAIAQVKDGDPSTIDVQKQINLEISAGELRRRRKAWKLPKPRYTRGVLAKYASAVSSASLGAVTDQNLKL